MEALLEGQVTGSAAEVYERFFVPALFEQWAGRVAEAAGLAPGEAVLDVACGTGVLAREAARRVAPYGSVTGLDRNEGMLAVARRIAPGIGWTHGRAENLPFGAASFDAVVSQFGLMFFEDRSTALREMWRVLRPGGRLAVAVWGRLDQTPGYAAMAALLQRLFGDRAADALRAPFVLGDPDRLLRLFAEAAIPARIGTSDGTARFSSIQAWMHTDVKGWTLAELIDEDQYGVLLDAAERELAGLRRPDGSVAFRMPAHIVTASQGAVTRTRAEIEVGL
jgi:SAM-dependent methyltransferase